MAAFRKYSDKYAFRVRSETPEIAVELSLQCYRRYKPDGVIVFSDILTPLPAMGVEFDVIGHRPRIDDPVRTPERCAEIAARRARRLQPGGEPRVHGRDAARARPRSAATRRCSASSARRGRSPRTRSRAARRATRTRSSGS